MDSRKKVDGLKKEVLPFDLAGNPTPGAAADGERGAPGRARGRDHAKTRYVCQKWTTLGPHCQLSVVSIMISSRRMLMIYTRLVLLFERFVQRAVLQGLKRSRCVAIFVEPGYSL